MTKLISEISPYQNMDFSYIAGFIDGDGSFEFCIRRRNKGKYSWFEPMFVIKIQQKTENGHDAMLKIAEFLNSNGVSCWVHKHKSTYKGRPYLSTQVTITKFESEIALIDKIKDCLTVKSAQAKLFANLLEEARGMKRGLGHGGKKYTAMVCLSLLKRWETVRMRRAMPRAWSIEKLEQWIAEGNQ